ncbi:FGGY family carbohydrate kinase [Streptomyces sp. M19]
MYGVLLAGFVPLSALMPSMVEHRDKGAALAVLNFGAGGAAFVGPFLVTICYPLIGGGGVAIVFSALYLAVGVVSTRLKDASDPGERPAPPGSGGRPRRHRMRTWHHPGRGGTPVRRRSARAAPGRPSRAACADGRRRLVSDQDVWVGVDLGTSSARAVAVDRRGRVLGRGAVPLIGSREGVRHTQPPPLWWTAAAAACRAAVREVAPERIGGVAVDATSGTVLLTDAEGEALTPGLMYDDQRAVAEAREADAHGHEVWTRLGYARVQRSWALPKLLWLLRHDPAARAPAYAWPTRTTTSTGG